MRNVLIGLLGIGILVTACGSAPASVEPTLSGVEHESLTATVKANSSGTAAPTALVLTATPVPATPTARPSPTPTVMSRVIGQDNLDQVVQLRDFSGDFSQSLGRSSSDVQANRIDFSANGERIAFTICYSNSSGYICSETADNDILVLDAKSGDFIQLLHFGKMRVAGVALSPDGETVYSLATNVSNSTLLKAWDVASGELKATLVDVRARMNIRPDLCVSQDGDHLAALLGPQGLRVITTIDGGIIREIPGAFSRCVFSQDGQRLIALEFDANFAETGLIAVDLTAGNILLRERPQTAVRGMAISPDGRQAVTTDDTGIVVWDLEQATGVKRLEGPAGEGWGFGEAVFSPDGSLLISSIRSGKSFLLHMASVWETTNWRRVSDLYGLALDITEMKFDAKGETFSIGTYDSDAALYGLPDAQLAEARMVMSEFMAALASGDFAAAADRFIIEPGSPDDISAWIIANGGDPDDLSTTFELACQPDAFPCLPVHEVLFSGRIQGGSILFVVTFESPGGGIFIDAHGESEFWLYADVDESGHVKMTSMHPGSFSQ
jgi:WD40 repeat protein